MNLSGLWWIGFAQFIICGLCTGLVFAMPKFHHFPSNDRPYILGIGCFLGVLAVFGLTIMALS